MPFHRIYAPKGFYSATDKAAFSEAITNVYSIIPPFFVIVAFIDLPEGDLFVGGKLSKNQVRISVEHTARNFANDENKRKFMERYEKAIQPFTKELGIEWEVQVVDCDRQLLTLNGMELPKENSIEEKIWKAENRAVSYEEMEEMKKRGSVNV